VDAPISREVAWQFAQSQRRRIQQQTSELRTQQSERVNGQMLIPRPVSPRPHDPTSVIIEFMERDPRLARKVYKGRGKESERNDEKHAIPLSC